MKQFRNSLPDPFSREAHRRVLKLSTHNLSNLPLNKARSGYHRETDRVA